MCMRFFIENFMKYFILLTGLIITMSSCTPKTKHQFIYEFETVQDLSMVNKDKVVKVIERRLNTLGFDPEIEVFDKDKFKIKISANKLNMNQINKVLANRGKLEFWHAYEAKDLFYYLVDVDKELMLESKKDSVKATSILESISSAGYGSIIGYIKTEDTIGILKALNENKQLLKPEHRFAKFMYGKQETGNALALYVIKGNRENVPDITSDAIIESSQDYGYTNQPVINLQMHDDAAVRWEMMTQKAYQDRTQIAIVVNDVVFSAPGVSNGAIKGGKTQISGGFNLQEAIDFASVFSGAGEIPKLTLVEYFIVEAE